MKTVKKKAVTKMPADKKQGIPAITVKATAKIKIKPKKGK